jgi:FAD binding domain
LTWTSDYPEESGDVNFVVGGAIAFVHKLCRSSGSVFNLLGLPRFTRDKTVLLKTPNGRWPTIWGDEKAREMVRTRRELLTWCSDLQSYPPTKQLLRLLAAYAESEHEQKILTYVSSA